MVFFVVLALDGGTHIMKYLELLHCGPLVILHTVAEFTMQCSKFGSQIEQPADGGDLEQ